MRAVLALIGLGTLVGCGRTAVCVGPEWVDLASTHARSTDVELRAELDGPHYGSRPVRAVRVEGVEGPLLDLARASVRVRVGQPLARADVRASAAALWALEVFDDVRVNVTEDRESTAVRFELVPRSRIGRVSVRGERKRLRPLGDAMRWWSDEPFERARVARGVGELATAYRERGYERARVEVRVRRASERIDLCIDVHSGPRFVLGPVVYDGIAAFSRDALEGLRDLREGAVNTEGGVLRRDLLAADVARLLAHYYDRGFVAARVESEVVVHEEHARVSLRFRVHEGPVHRFGAVSVRGSPVAFELRVREGQGFSRATVLEEVERLQRELGPSWHVAIESHVDSATPTVAIELVVEPVDRSPPIEVDSNAHPESGSDHDGVERETESSDEHEPSSAPRLGVPRLRLELPGGA